MKFIHTADWQIGMKAAHAGAVGARLREARLEAARRVVEAAAAHGAEFLLLAGDTFEDNAVDRVLVQKTADLLRASAVPVYVLPGNHDPRVPGSVWDHPAWREQDRVRILDTPEPVEVPGGVLFPCPVLEKHSRKDPTAWITAGSQAGMTVPEGNAGPPGTAVTTGPRIGVAHGTVEGMPQLDPDHPIPRDAAARAGLDYLALGHWHSTAFYEDPAGAVRMAYSGTHETTRFGERDSGNVLVVEVSAGCPPSVTPLKTGGLSWLALGEEIGRPGDLARIRALAEKAENPQTTLIEVRLSGLLPGSDGPELARLAEVLESRFLYHRLDTGALRPAPQDEAWLEGLPQGALREAALRLRELAAASQPAAAQPETAIWDTSPADPASSDAASRSRIAARALLELYALAQGGEP